jgi:hypothetical protein
VISLWRAEHVGGRQCIEIVVVLLSTLSGNCKRAVIGAWQA